MKPFSLLELYLAVFLVAKLHLPSSKHLLFYDVVGNRHFVWHLLSHCHSQSWCGANARLSHELLLPGVYFCSVRHQCAIFPILEMTGWYFWLAQCHRGYLSPKTLCLVSKYSLKVWWCSVFLTSLQKVPILLPGGSKWPFPERLHASNESIAGCPLKFWDAGVPSWPAELGCWFRSDLGCLWALS